ncbi:hypothetical protein IAU59_002501 [Kwoniella sp. CBS 9459]
MPSDAPGSSSRRPLTLLPFSGGPSSARSPHIRTPPSSSTSSSFFTTNFKNPSSSSSTSSGSSRRSMFGGMTSGSGVPRPVLRGILFVTVLVGLLLLSRASKESQDGVWDASSWSDRRGEGQGVGMKAVRKKFTNWSAGAAANQNYNDYRNRKPNPKLFNSNRDAPEYQIDEEGDNSMYDAEPAPHPNLSRLNHTAPTPVHPGQSRKIIKGTNPEKYTYHPLPTLDEAWAFLHPLLKEVKDRTDAVPREHELTHPIFPPFLTENLVQRYNHLRMSFDQEQGDWVLETKRRWLMVTVCRQVAGMLADWFAAWTVLADFLGPESLVFSLVEGDSADGSGEILSQVMRAHLLHIGVPPENIYIKTFAPKFDWEKVHRIEQLAEMRNEGMKPFFDSLPSGLSPDGQPWTGIVYYNDVYLSATHFLELMHQHFKQDADMTCGWDHAGRWFYDGWVGRDMSGDLYTPFPVKEEDKDLPQKLFPSSPETLRRYNRMLPFQVFAGWNGITVLNPQPFLPPYNVKFRRGKPRTNDFWECQASESSFISWDFWKYGFGKIQVVPGVHATYGKEDAMMRGWVEWPSPGDGLREEIDWNHQPPAKVRCHDWPDKPGKGYWAWDTVRWVDPPKLEVPKNAKQQE